MLSRLSRPVAACVEQFPRRITPWPVDLHSILKLEGFNKPLNLPTLDGLDGRRQIIASLIGRDGALPVELKGASACNII